ncbi:MAG: DegT/DnrJ/EryC1/StrS family aminotransferase [Bacteriovorax sp.]|jgi:hypothetical protein
MKAAKTIYRPTLFIGNEGRPRGFELDNLFRAWIPFNLGRETIRSLFSELIKKKEAPLKVLMPEFICADVPEALNGLNVDITWYSVDIFNLDQLNIDVNLLKSHDCLFVVNYFGLATSLQKLNEAPNLIVIEDNAHGFLGRDLSGELLGTRGDFGIFSLRKTLPISSGAALFCSTMHSEIEKTIREVQQKKELIEVSVSKTTLRDFSQIIPLKLFHWLLSVKRNLAKNASQSEKLTAESKRISFPGELLLRLDPDLERERRKRLYEECLGLFEPFKEIIKVIPFNEKEIPYGFVFYLVESSKLNRIRQKIENSGMDLIKWPELPAVIESKYSDEHPYKNVYFIPFIW